jgi:hypothetical protein
VRAYKKTTQHPFCLYLTSDELIELLNEMADAINLGWKTDEQYPVMDKVHDRLNNLLKEPSEDHD